MLLSDRMQAVVGLVQPCDRIADIGCDHGYIAMELVKRHICKEVIAADINQGPLKQARGNILEYAMQEYIETRLSDGVDALEPGEAEGMVCAGMGGRLIIDILKKGMEKVSVMEQLILQPQSEISEVRCFLRESGFQIDKEDMVCEEGKYYPMMHVIPGVFGKQERQIAGNLIQKSKKSGRTEEEMPPAISEVSRDEAVKLRRVQDTYGPYLLEKAHPVLKQYLLWQKENYENIRGNLMNRKVPNARQQYRIAELDGELSDIVFCLYKYFS